MVQFFKGIIKVSKSFTLKGTTIDTDYLDGFVYTSTYTQQLEAALLEDDLATREAATAGQEEALQLEQKVVVNNSPSVASAKPSFFPTAEGFFDYDNLKYIYQYKDHLGNVRLSYSKNATTGLIAIEDTNDYYPFGLSFINTSASKYSPSTTYKNTKFQTQELQETGFYQFKWRQYMPDVARFFNIDPLAEKYQYWTPYAFSGNRVIDSRELEGLEPVEINKGTKNLVIVNQGYVGSPPPGSTQAQNYTKYNKESYIDYDGIGVINNLNSSTTQVGIFASSKGETTKNDILSTISSFREKSPDGKLIMVGHSMGADNLVELVNEHTEVKVDLLFTLDIADDPRSGIDDDNIPSNVKNAVNYYNNRDGFMGVGIGGEDIEVNDSQKTNALNVPVSSSHKTIDNEYRFNAYNAVVNELNKK